MCLAVPMRIEAITGTHGVVAYSGGQYDVRLDLVEDVKVGDYVMVHTGIAIAKIDEAEAEETLNLLRQMNEVPN
jgi:hydrogenase expression/formation protein HypC